MKEGGKVGREGGREKKGKEDKEGRKQIIPHLSIYSWTSLGLGNHAINARCTTFNNKCFRAQATLY